MKDFILYFLMSCLGSLAYDIFGAGKSFEEITRVTNVIIICVIGIFVASIACLL